MAKRRKLLQTKIYTIEHKIYDDDSLDERRVNRGFGAYELMGLKNNEIREIGAAKKGQSGNAKANYIKGINEVLLHTRESMVDGALAVIVINDKYGLYKPEDVGFKSIGRVERHVNRRTGRRNGAFYESILIWRKV